MTYTYLIESTEDAEIWQAVTGGTETADDAIEEYARAVLDNWLDDKRANGETTRGWRVRVWRGSEQATPEADHTLESDMPLTVGTRVTVPDYAVPADWAHDGEIVEIGNETVIVELSDGHRQELPDDEVTPA